MLGYRLHGMTVTVTSYGTAWNSGLQDFLEDLSFVPDAGHEPRYADVQLSVRCREPKARLVPAGAQPVFQHAGLAGFTDGTDYYLSEGSSVFRVRTAQRQGLVTLAPGFSRSPRLLQQQFWALGLLTLLRPLGLFGLHAAGVVSPAGMGFLITGESGSGKSTLALGLVREGWSYVSDDSVLLRNGGASAEALRLRRPGSILGEDAGRFPELGLDGPPIAPGRKRRIDLRRVYSDRCVPRFTPDVVLFSKLSGRETTELQVLDRVSALKCLLEQSGPQRMDQSTTQRQFSVLKSLIDRCALYELRAGWDLYHQPSRLLQLLADAES